MRDPGSERDLDGLGVTNGVQRQWVEMSGNIATAVGMACLFVSFKVSFKGRRQ